jgi:serine/threonine-protein kinase
VSLPSRIGRYEVLGNLAFGGMAEILLARLMGPSGFERIVVIKRILPHLKQRRGFVEMFLDEARTVARIHHPNVVVVHELGEADDELFLVMEYLQGESVAGLLRRLCLRHDALEPRLAAHIAAEACRGLHAAHDLRDPDGVPLELVHRDVSPQNLFVTYAGNVHVLDFGVARVADQQGRTEVGQVKGKRAYMSPEQCKGRTLDRRSDVFSMGAVLFEMLTGTALFRRDTEHATYRAICDEPIPRASELVASLPTEIDRITARALSRHRGERYATASEMRAELMAAISRQDAGSADEALEAVMRRLFADRIAEKADMLRRARSGSPLSYVPPADVDENVDLPTMGAQPTLRNADESALRSVSRVGDESQPRDRRRRSARTWAASVSVAAITAGVFALARRQADPVPERGALLPVAQPAQSSHLPAEAPSGAPSTAPTSPTSAESAPGRVRVRVETTPAGARITIDGRDHGVTPKELELVRSEQAVILVLRREGFHPLTERLVPSTDQRLVLPLRPADRPSARGSIPAPAAVPAPPATIEKLP